ncbi:hypothetical protein [Hellea balneolensis]|uniref:hypothetical protein n=1 Tax=Hellea balneolensis TaxID=287478 RepID=UPI0004082C10|nr:hypothetical protein [Hellea balneolensis]
MRYFGYALILVAIAGGYTDVHPILIILLALLSTLIYASARRKALKNQPQAADQNMMLDGAYLLAGQTMIMFAAFILGWFFANRVALGSAS